MEKSYQKPHKYANAYYDSIETILNSIAEIIAQREQSYPLALNEFSGRAGSSHFEDGFLKPLIRKHESILAGTVNEKLRSQGNLFRFVRIEAEENMDESAARSMADVVLYLRRPDGEVTVEPINIKATAGKTADNVGGWEAFNHCLYGYDGYPVKQRDKLLEKISKVKFNSNVYDYFLWVFHKDLSGAEEILRSSAVHSMLGSSLEAFAVNMSQNFPLQFNSHKAERVRFTEDHGILKAKNELFTKVSEKEIEAHKRQYKSWVSSRNAQRIVEKKSHAPLEKSKKNLSSGSSEIVISLTK